MSGAPSLPAGYRLVSLDSVGSTNAEASRLAADGAEEGTLVWAREQTAGRGRRGRDWTSPPGNLYMSLLLKPVCPPADAAQLGFVAALAIAEGLDAVSPPTATLRLKWPNDVLLNGKKVCGVLMESSVLAGRSTLDWLIIGMGVNLVSSPPDTRYPATCLADQGFDDPPVARVLESVIAGFAGWHTRWRSAGFEPVRANWLANAAGLGEEIEVRLEAETMRGRFADLDEAGALVLDLPNGQRRIGLGDVFPVTG